VCKKPDLLSGFSFLWARKYGVIDVAEHLP